MTRIFLRSFLTPKLDGGSSYQLGQDYRLDFILVHKLLEEVCPLTVAGLAEALATHFLVNPIEIIDDSGVDSGE
jgi:hypothetical protein